MTSKMKKFIKPLILVVFLLLIIALPWIINNVYWIHIFILIAIMILATSSMRAINRTGEISLGTAGFMLLGGYCAALLTKDLGLSPWLTMPLGGLFAAVVAAALGYPFFRIKGVYFVIATLLTSFIFLYIAGYFNDLTGGWQGLQFFSLSPDPITIGSWTISFTNQTNIEYYYLVIIVVSLCLFVLYRMENSRIGLVWKSIRESDNLAQSVGVNIMAHKIFIFVIACFFTGLAGGLYAFHVHALSPTTTPANIFHFFTSIYCLLYMVVGGIDSFYGPIIGTTLFMLLSEFTRSIQEYRPLVYGGILILIIFFMPKGLMALPYYIKEWHKKFAKRSQGKSAQKSILKND
jgi:branched-chain amino acid transport system permease protein